MRDCPSRGQVPWGQTEGTGQGWERHRRAVSEGSNQGIPALSIRPQGDGARENDERMMQEVLFNT